jgi:hypothetical protein
MNVRTLLHGSPLYYACHAANRDGLTLSVQCTRLENAPVVLNFKTLWFVGGKKLSEDVRYGVGKVSTIVDNIYRFFTR